MPLFKICKYIKLRINKNHVENLFLKLFAMVEIFLRENDKTMDCAYNMLGFASLRVRSQTTSTI